MQLSCSQVLVHILIFNEPPQGKPCGIEDLSLKSLRMRGNKSPVPTAPRGAVLNRKRATPLINQKFREHFLTLFIRSRNCSKRWTVGPVLFWPQNHQCIPSLPLLDFRIVLIPCQTRNYGAANWAVKRRGGKPVELKKCRKPWKEMLRSSRAISP